MTSKSNGVTFWARLFERKLLFNVLNFCLYLFFRIDLYVLPNISVEQNLGVEK